MTEKPQIFLSHITEERELALIFKIEIEKKIFGNIRCVFI